MWKERYKQLKNPLSFNVGDKIEYIGNSLNSYFDKGEIITIKMLPDKSVEDDCFTLRGPVGRVHEDYFFGLNSSSIQFKKVNK